MKVWRLVRAGCEAYAGIGSELAPGRWHTPPRRVVYAAASPELAILEKLVWVRRLERLRGFQLVPATLPERCLGTLERPPDGWNAAPHRSISREAGNAWLDRRSSLALIVPSAISPGRNVLIDPMHPDMHRITVNDAMPVPPALTTASARP